MSSTRGLVGWGGHTLERGGGEAENTACYARIGVQRRLASGRREKGVFEEVYMTEGLGPQWVGDREFGGGWRPRRARIGVRD